MNATRKTPNKWRLMSKYDYNSWGRYPRSQPHSVQRIDWRDPLPDLNQMEPHVLPYALGRSYGDSCLNNGGVLLDVRGLNRFIAFDRERGLLRCEAGVSLEDILDLVVPEGWFLAVTPGSKFVTVGGAIANDVHGKNHHVAGTFGCHVTQLELLRSDGERLLCSREENDDYFAATLGGLGLTGLILWAEIQLKPIPTPFIQQETIRFDTLEQFFELSAQMHHVPYTVSWVDCTATGPYLGRGLFTHGDFYDPPMGPDRELGGALSLPVPLDPPMSLINGLTSALFNQLYFRKQLKRRQASVGHYNGFFYPLDALTDWYRIYGQRGFLQYQFVIPYEETIEPIRDIFQRIARSRQATPLVVFKTFGEMRSPGMLSFPRPGVTLALDFPNNGARLLRLLDELDEIVFANGGALYPAKDARMSGASFRRSYPNWETFAQYIDPKFSSSFWRRVTQD